MSTTTDTGPDRTTRQLVLQRAQSSCELCGQWAVAAHIHHRRPRQMGGTSDPAANRPSNLVLLCGICHRWVETIDRAPAYQFGWLVPQGKAPAECAFLLWGEWVYLTDDGTYARPHVDAGHDDIDKELF